MSHVRFINKPAEYLPIVRRNAVAIPVELPVGAAASRLEFELHVELSLGYIRASFVAALHVRRRLGRLLHELHREHGAVDAEFPLVHLQFLL